MTPQREGCSAWYNELVIRPYRYHLRGLLQSDLDRRGALSTDVPWS